MVRSASYLKAAASVLNQYSKVKYTLEEPHGYANVYDPETGGTIQFAKRYSLG